MALSVPADYRSQNPGLAARAEAAFRCGSVAELKSVLLLLPESIVVKTSSGKCRGHQEDDIERYTAGVLWDDLNERCRVLEASSGIESAMSVVRPDMKDHSPVAFGLLHVFTLGAFTATHALVTCRQGYCTYKHYDWATNCPHITHANATISLATMKAQLRAKSESLQQQEHRRQEEEERQRRLRQQEQERLQRLEQARIENERRERERQREQERVERERQERLRREEQERLRREQDRHQQEQRERREREEQAALEAAGARRRQAQKQRLDQQERQQQSRHFDTHFGQTQAHIGSPRNDS